MSEPIQVSPEDLLAAGAQVERHAADVQGGHAAADARIQSAQTGMVGMSAAAVEAKLAQWQLTTAALHQRLTDQAQAFTTSGAGYHDTDTDNATSIAKVGEEGAQTGRSGPLG
jgi:WXG100 family type VII secretion target